MWDFKKLVQFTCQISNHQMFSNTKHTLFYIWVTFTVMFVSCVTKNVTKYGVFFHESIEFNFDVTWVKYFFVLVLQTYSTMYDTTDLDVTKVSRLQLCRFFSPFYKLNLLFDKCDSEMFATWLFLWRSFFVWFLIEINCHDTMTIALAYRKKICDTILGFSQSAASVRPVTHGEFCNMWDEYLKPKSLDVFFSVGNRF